MKKFKYWMFPYGFLSGAVISGIYTYTYLIWNDLKDYEKIIWLISGLGISIFCWYLYGIQRDYNLEEKLVGRT
jgi:hypothetical protein